MGSCGRGRWEVGCLAGVSSCDGLETFDWEEALGDGGPTDGGWKLEPVKEVSEGG